MADMKATSIRKGKDVRQQCAECGATPKPSEAMSVHYCLGCKRWLCKDCLAERGQRHGFGWGAGPALFYQSSNDQWVCADCFAQP